MMMMMVIEIELFLAVDDTCVEVMYRGMGLLMGTNGDAIRGYISEHISQQAISHISMYNLINPRNITNLPIFL